MTPQTYQALAIANALEIYAEHHRKVNTAYTPRNMIATASRLTGQTFRARDYLGAAAALRQLAREQGVRN